jgi:hypothetical protein
MCVSCQLSINCYFTDDNENSCFTKLIKYIKGGRLLFLQLKCSLILNLENLKFSHMHNKHNLIKLNYYNLNVYFISQYLLRYAFKFQKIFRLYCSNKNKKHKLNSLQ